MNDSPVAQIKFGTDGWRAIIAREFTFANVERVTQAYADFLTREAEGAASPFVVIGFDRRFLSEKFAARAAEVLVANGFRIALFTDAQPTPLISWTVKNLGANGGVMITASHNPPNFNGFKIKALWGGSAPPETTREVEKLVDATPPKRTTVADDGHALLEPSIARYREQIASYVDLERLKNATGKVIVDPMHGSAGRWVESFLSGGTLAVETIRDFRDPLFGGVNPEPIDQNLGPLKERVVETRALVGLATDGDADRVGAVDELGRTMTMHDVVPLLLLHLARARNMTGAVVVTVSQSVLTKRIANAMGLKIDETPIGFKYIAELMLKEDILLGAEESGGIGVKGHIPERDGVLNSLLFLEAIVTAGKPPSQMLADLHREFGEFHFGRRDLHMPVSRGQALVAQLSQDPPADYARFKVTKVETTDGAKLIFDDESWLLFRQSGTEPALRVYSEATSVEKMNALLDAGVATTDEHGHR
ncbi:MAG TPA: phosphoglucomutase/phosphomannomutase family protein [Pyrinomonadaceae bacterium]|nr:phosphoglucomutase/phosphomannomutase family protein [Pyrinomonadaceae bacterium]